MNTYHAAVGFPASFTPPTTLLGLRYSRHAERAAQNDRYGQVDCLPVILNPATAQLIEITLDSAEQLVKAVWRVRYSEDLDVVLVVNPNDHVVITVWLNAHNDDHKTLNTKRYARPETA